MWFEAIFPMEAHHLCNDMQWKQNHTISYSQVSVSEEKLTSSPFPYLFFPMKVILLPQKKKMNAGEPFG